MFVIICKLYYDISVAQIYCFSLLNYYSCDQLSVGSYKGLRDDYKKKMNTLLELCEHFMHNKQSRLGHDSMLKKD